MNFTWSFILLIAGLLGLWKSGDWIVESAHALSAYYRISSAFIGFVLLALASNIPELAVAIMAIIHDAGQVSAGDIIGANFNDIALVIGLALFFTPSITLKSDEIREMIRTIIMASFVMIGVLIQGILSPIHGILLLGLYILFVMWSWFDQDSYQSEENISNHHTWQQALTIWYTFIGSIIIILTSSSAVVFSALSLAQLCSIQLEALGATIIAIGTSLPEIAIGITALRKKDYALALGPTIGTIFAQATLTLGVLTIFSQTPINLHVLLDSALFMFSAFAILLYALMHDHLHKKTGFYLICLFISYVIYHCYMIL